MATSRPVAVEQDPELPGYTGIYNLSLEELHGAWTDHVLRDKVSL